MKRLEFRHGSEGAKHQKPSHGIDGNRPLESRALERFDAQALPFLGCC